MSDIKKMTETVLKFRDDRDWKKFHTGKDCAIGLTLEASEVAELFLWKTEQQINEAYRGVKKEDLADELADVLYWVLLIAHDFEIDISEALESKLKKSALKYPIEKAKGSATKYTEL